MEQIRSSSLEDPYIRRIAYTFAHETMRWVDEYPRNGDIEAIEAARQEILGNSFKLVESFFVALAQHNAALHKQLTELAMRQPLPTIIFSPPSQPHPEHPPH